MHGVSFKAQASRRELYDQVIGMVFEPGPEKDAVLKKALSLPEVEEMEKPDDSDYEDLIDALKEDDANDPDLKQESNASQKKGKTGAFQFSRAQSQKPREKPRESAQRNRSGNPKSAKWQPRGRSQNLVVLWPAPMLVQPGALFTARFELCAPLRVHPDAVVQFTGNHFPILARDQPRIC